MQTIIYKNAILLRLKAKKAGATRREHHVVAKKNTKVCTITMREKDRPQTDSFFDLILHGVALIAAKRPVGCNFVSMQLGFL